MITKQETEERVKNKQLTEKGYLLLLESGGITDVLCN